MYSVSAALGTVFNANAIAPKFRDHPSVISQPSVGGQLFLTKIGRSETNGGTGTPQRRLLSGSSVSGEILSKLKRKADVGDNCRSISLNLFMKRVKSIPCFLK
uniref:Uncharacterized protein n=1 Tax=Glossina austeni TaxID=7395 RepID=A0A1A9VST5_GLOAU